jgi:hypothetical protein
LDVPRPRSNPGAGALHLIVDSKGPKFHGPGERLVENCGIKKRRSLRKPHIGLDADIDEILASDRADDERRR